VPIIRTLSRREQKPRRASRSASFGLWLSMRAQWLCVSSVHSVSGALGTLRALSLPLSRDLPLSLSLSLSLELSLSLSLSPSLFTVMTVCACCSAITLQPPLHAPTAALDSRPRELLTSLLTRSAPRGSPCSRPCPPMPAADETTLSRGRRRRSLPLAGGRPVHRSAQR
jgi:hypothetical protein